MTIVSFANATVTRLRAAVTPDTDGSNYGNAVVDWSAADSLDLFGWSVQPIITPEVQGADRNSVGTRWELIRDDPDTDVLATDRLILPDGRTYQVDGEPLRYSLGVLDHIELIASLVVG